jgi:hypothetical protein
MPHVFQRYGKWGIERDAAGSSARTVSPRLDRQARRRPLQRPFSWKGLPAIEEIQWGLGGIEIRRNARKGTCLVSPKRLPKECAKVGIPRGREQMLPGTDLANRHRLRRRCENSSATAFDRIEMANAPPSVARNDTIEQVHASRSRCRSDIQQPSTLRRQMRQSPLSE